MFTNKRQPGWDPTFQANYPSGNQICLRMPDWEKTQGSWKSLLTSLTLLCLSAQFAFDFWSLMFHMREKGKGKNPLFLFWPLEVDRDKKQNNSRRDYEKRQLGLGGWGKDMRKICHRFFWGRKKLSSNIFNPGFEMSAISSETCRGSMNND